jgi:uncharacterized protein DUF3465
MRFAYCALPLLGLNSSFRERRMKKLLLLIAIVAAGYFGLVQYRGSGPIAEFVETTASSSDSELARAFESRSSNVQVEGQGSVAKLLSDDTAGSRHQRFILRLQSGQTVLIAQHRHRSESRPDSRR